MQTRRRNFLKMTAAGAAGLAFGKPSKAFAAWPTTGTMNINSTINNMRVVACYDTRMMSTPTAMTFAAENAAVNSAQVAANMDAMAMSLAGTTTASTAWSTIFTSSKAWSATKVAIKVNTIEPKNMARVAVIQKFCEVIAGLGVPPANIIVYDGNATFGGGMSNYTPYFSLTDATKIQAVLSNYNDSLGGTVSTPIPGGTSATCSADIANGTIDILINIFEQQRTRHVVQRRRDVEPKEPFRHIRSDHELDYIFNINKSDAIIGGTPVRQQLCFIDSLIANKASNTGTPEVMPNYLVMGTFGPAVDYATIENLRKTVLGITPASQSIMDSYITTFGYATTDPQWIVVQPASADGGVTGSSGSSSGSSSSSGSRPASSSSSSSGSSSSGAGPSGSSTSSSGTGPSGSSTSSSGTGPSGSSTSSSGAGSSSGTATSTSSGASAGGSSSGIHSSSSGSGAADETPAGGNSGGGCEVAIVKPDAAPWGGLLVAGAVIAGAARRSAVGRSEKQSPVTPACPHEGSSKAAADEPESTQEDPPSQVKP